MTFCFRRKIRGPIVPFFSVGSSRFGPSQTSLHRFRPLADGSGTLEGVLGLFFDRLRCFTGEA